jgi:dephospho-CoA kinase
MAFLIAVAGLSGAGKTTAVDYLKDLGLGQKVYLGDTVLNEVRARGLPSSPENERLVRLDIRLQHGPGALAVLAGPAVKELLDEGVNVFVDAIFEAEEYQHLETCCGNSTSVLLAIEASFETRALRLRSRAERPLTREELKVRDETEMTRLGTSMIMARAGYKIVNEGSIQAFQNDLKGFWKSAAASAVTHS